MQAFDRLARPIQKWIRSKGWRELRDIQARATHQILTKNEHLIVAASTAGGKTEAAFLPLLSNVLDHEGPAGSGFDLVYIGPLKALINDQCKRLEDICAETELRVTPWHGDVSASIKSKAEKQPSGILLITPESLEALFVRKGNSIPHLFGRTRAFIIDELHTFLDTERGVHLRSLMARLELSIGRRVRKVGLSATLGDISLAKAYLDSDRPDQVEDIIAQGGEAELHMQLRAYISGGEEDDAALRAISDHLFDRLRGSNNLIFAGSRGRVEDVADRLRRKSEEERLPNEFYPHHASLSKEHREFVEERLKSAALPTTAICTSTLELGIDIGDVTCVAQIGAPFTVAGLRQRLGRSGRRAGQPAILRQYAIETQIDQDSHFTDRLRLGLVRSVAMINLLLSGWCEAPNRRALHLSTFVHQILSIIAERGGASAKRIFATLCDKGPFRSIEPALFVSVLRHLGSPDVALIEQSEDGMLLLGKTGEKIVEHYSFYAVFKTPEEYRIVHHGKTLGTLPIVQVLAPKMALIFSGRRWEVLSVEEADKTILVKPAPSGRPPKFGGEPGLIDDRVIEEMRGVYLGDDIPNYLDETAAGLLCEARRNFKLLGLKTKRILSTGETKSLLATWQGSVKSNTLALALTAKGFTVTAYDGMLDIEGKKAECSLEAALVEIQAAETPYIFTSSTNLIYDKFHPYLSSELLQQDAMSGRLDLNALPTLAALA